MRCSACKGTTACETCNGSGWRAEGTVNQNKCSACKGTGTCRLCEGSGKEPPLK